MKNSSRKLSLTSYDDIFTPEGQAMEDGEKLRDIPLSELYPFPHHPFKVRDDEQMTQTAESIQQYGVLVPAIVRPRREGGYEIIAGHRRKRGSELAGRETLPCIVRDMDDDAATIFMVDSNIQRENIPPSERAAAYKMKLEAIKRQGARTDLTCAQVGHKLNSKKSVVKVAEDSGESKTQIQRFIRLTELTPELQQMVDERKIAMTPAVELSYLRPEEQALLVDTIMSEQATPSLSQAQRIKKLSQEGRLDDDSMLGILSEQKKPEKRDVTLTGDKLSRYFPRSYTPQRMEETILRLLDAWMKKRQRDQER